MAIPLIFDCWTNPNRTFLVKATIFSIKADFCILKKKKVTYALLFVMLPVVSPLLYSSAERESSTFLVFFFSLSHAKQESCQAIVVWYSEGSWDLVTGSFLLTATSQQFPQGVKLTMMQGDGHLMTRSTNLLHNTVINKGICFCRKQSIFPP